MRYLANHHVKEKTEPICAAGSRKFFDDDIGSDRTLYRGIDAIMVAGEKNVAVSAGREYWSEQDMVETHVLAAA
jgi:hypothetical protein